MLYHDCRKTQQQLTDWLFAEQPPVLPAELVDCRPCLDQYLALQDSLRLFEQATPGLEPAEDYWAGYEARLRVKLAQEATPARWRHWFSWGGARDSFRPLWLVPVAAAFLLLLFGMAWRWRQTPAPVTTQTPAVAFAKVKPGDEKDSDATKARKRKLDKQAKPERKEPSRPPDKKPYLLSDPNPILASASLPVENAVTIQHVERAQRLLRSFRNSSPMNNERFDLAYEKKQARQLLYQNILLRREAETRGDWPTEEVLTSLEALLLDIGNLPTRPVADDVTPIKERMQKKEIVARLQLFTTAVTVASAD